MAEPMDDALASKTVRDYACAACYGHLIQRPAPGRAWFVECAAYGSEHAGYVTKYYTARRRSESIGEKMDVNANLRDLGIIENPHKGKSAIQLINELGF